MSASVLVRLVGGVVATSDGLHLQNLPRKRRPIRQQGNIYDMRQNQRLNKITFHVHK